MASEMDTEKSDDKKEKKRKKKEERAAKKAEKKAAKQGGENEDEDGSEKLGSKILLFFVTLLIIAIWIGIIALFIKADVGGFGSDFLTPILKDVPIVNKILPESDEFLSTEQIDTQYQFDSIADAVEQIKALELQLDQAYEQSAKDQQELQSQKEQIEKLSVYKQEQEQFERDKEKFYEEVVFSQEAPDIEEYKNFYEMIDPENAEVLYKQVVQQLEEDEEVMNYVKTYTSMKPKEVAAIFDTMEDNLALVSRILGRMDIETRSAVMAKMDKELAAKLTAIMEPDR